MWARSAGYLTCQYSVCFESRVSLVDKRLQSQQDEVGSGEEFTQRFERINRIHDLRAGATYDFSSHS